MKTLSLSPTFRFFLIQILSAILALALIPRLVCPPPADIPVVDSRKAAPFCGTPTPVEILLWDHDRRAGVTLDLESYVVGVVAGEMPASFEEEALKAQAVAARTFSVSRTRRAAETGNPSAHSGFPLCDDVHCQVYRSEPELKKLKGDDWMGSDYRKIQRAVKDTEGQILYYGTEPVTQPLFHSSSGGRTENSEDVFVSAVPYLRSVESAYEQDAPYSDETLTMSFSEFSLRRTLVMPKSSMCSNGNLMLRMLRLLQPLMPYSGSCSIWMHMNWMCCIPARKSSSPRDTDIT